jgi:FMN phosphatase YigB (HAD superfamily)
VKLVSDFDGVLTELSSEADRVKQLFVGFLELGSELNRFEEELKQNPHLYGWNIHGRITAYSDEDSLIYNNALAAYLDSLSQSESILQTSLQKLSLKGITDFKQAAQKAYLTMCEEVLNSNATPIDSKTSPVLGSLLNSGAEVVVVSNSGSERIQNIFSKAGILSHSRFF